MQKLVSVETFFFIFVVVEYILLDICQDLPDLGADNWIKRESVNWFTSNQ